MSRPHGLEVVPKDPRLDVLASRQAQANAKALRVAFVTNVLPHYRAGFVRRLLERRDMEVQVFCQSSIPGMTLKMCHSSFPDRVTLVPYVGLRRERLGWQNLPWRRLLGSFDVLVVLGNPRVLSNVALVSLARCLGRSVVLYGHAHTAGASRFTEAIRLWWWRWFDNLLVYTDGEVRRLRGRGFGRHHLVGLNNGLDQRRIDEASASWNPARLAAWRQSQGLEGRTQVLSCARLERKNRFDLWLKALPAVVSSIPDLLWCVVGDGPERENLELQTRQLGLSGHVRWLGTIVDESELAPWFLSSKLFVHPAGIGLSLLHAFGYGLPVVTHDDAASQMPEFDAFVPGETGFLYGRGDPADLASVACQCLVDEEARHGMAVRARRVAREEYNVQIMAERFAEVASLAAGSRGITLQTSSSRP